MKLQRLSLRKPLPVRNGLSPSAIWLPKGNWILVLDFLDSTFNEVSRQSWVDRMKKNEVVDEHGHAFSPTSTYRSDIHLFYYRELLCEAAIPFDENILYEDEHIMVADKPHFLPTAPAGRFLHETLLVRLQKRCAMQHLVPIHRLDRETAGVLALSKNPATRGAYQRLFAAGKVQKTYEACAPALPEHTFPISYSSCIKKGSPFFRMAEVAGVANTLTRISVLAKLDTGWLYQLEPTTGKKHQLRVHMASMGAPIYNDPFYPDLKDDKGIDYRNPLQLLAKKLCFKDPISGEKRCFTTQQTLAFTQV